MKLRVLKKSFTLLMLLIIIFSFIGTNVYAVGMGDIIQKGDDFLNAGNGSTITLESDALTKMSDTIYNVLLVVGIVLAFIIGIIIGMQFLLGSIEQKAKVKETLIPYFAGCVIIFGAFGIWKLVVTIMQSMP